MKKIFLTIIALSIITLIGCESSSVSNDKKYQLSVKNKNALKLYNSAQLKSERGDYSGSKADFEAALRIEPDFIMVLLNINENNVTKKTRYIKRAYDNYENATDSEKIFIDLTRKSIDKEKREMLLLKLVELNPNSSDAHRRLANFYGNSNDTEKRDLHNLKALKINPNNMQIKRSIFNRKYRAGFFSESAINDKNFFNFKDSVEVFEKEINELVSIDSLNVSVYRDIGDKYRQSTLYLDRSLEYYLKGVDIAGLEGNSYRAELLHTAGNASFLMGKIDDAFKFYNQSLDVEFDPFLKMKRTYQLSTAYFFDQNHKAAIKILDDFENQLISFGFNQTEINQALISIYWYKSFIYADMGDKSKSNYSWGKFEIFADKLIEEVDDIRSFVSSRNRRYGNVASGLNDRISRADPELREVDNILLNILNMDLDNAEKLIIESGKEFTSFKFIMSFLNSDANEINRIISKGFDPFSSNTYEGGMISRFYYGKYLIDQNKMVEAKNTFYKLANIRGFGFPVGHIKKKSIEIFNSMQQYSN
tara:strand:+ start:1480 stop:3081 length:1602 start_codon:yes stop_codon:yes gene_type:complete